MDSKSKKRLMILKAKNKGKLLMESYQKELEQLVKGLVYSDRILSFEETQEIGFVTGQKIKLYLAFENKAELKAIINQLVKEKDGEMFLITHYSKFCGAYLLSSLNDFNVEFSFKAEHQGLVQIKLKDGSNELLLDFYESNNKQMLDIEIIGKDWTNQR